MSPNEPRTHLFILCSRTVLQILPVRSEVADSTRLTHSSTCVHRFNRCVTSYTHIHACAPGLSVCSGSRQVAFFFEFGNDSCTSDDGIIRVHGALHAEALPTAYKLILLAYPAFRVLTARCVSARSQLEGDCRPYSASTQLPWTTERLQTAYRYGPGGRAFERGRRRRAGAHAIGHVHASRAVTV